MGDYPHKISTPVICLRIADCIFDGFVKSLPMTLCHSERSEESNHIKIFQILHEVYPVPKI
jgi:hypothetical protein